MVGQPATQCRSRHAVTEPVFHLSVCDKTTWNSSVDAPQFTSYFLTCLGRGLSEWQSEQSGEL